jgi:arylamine N-acetyltransferase
VVADIAHGLLDQRGAVLVLQRRGREFIAALAFQGLPPATILPLRLPALPETAMTFSEKS